MPEARAQNAPLDLNLRLAGRESCEDTMLVATSALSRSEAFGNTVVYMVAHNAAGATGVVINRPTGVQLGSVLPDETRAALPEVMMHAAALHGGPVDPSVLWALHPTIPDAPSKISNAAMSLSTTPDEFAPVGSHAVLHGAGVGTVGWEAGQLEREIDRRAWVAIPRQTVLFEVPPAYRYGAALELIDALLPGIASQWRANEWTP